MRVAEEHRKVVQLPILKGSSIGDAFRAVSVATKSVQASVNNSLHVLNVSAITQRLKEFTATRGRST